jgi:predicted ester cyclase
MIVELMDACRSARIRKLIYFWFVVSKGVPFMDALEMAQAFVDALEAKDMEKAGTYLSEDFRLYGPTPMPVGKHEFLALQGALFQAFPDWSFNSAALKQEGNKVTGTVRITATHTAPLVLPGIPPIAATGKHVVLPEERTELTFEGDKIVSLASDNVPGGGVPGMLQQIGLQLPAQ